jgi:hypothetical protein
MRIPLPALPLPLSLSLLLLLAACAIPPPPPPTATAPPPPPVFDAQEAAAATRGGNNEIAGHAFVFVRHGGRRSCAGETASLIPATGYAIWRMRKIYGTRPAVPIVDAPELPPDPDLERFVAHAKCDRRGHFIFADVADGAWYITVRIGNWSLRRRVNLGGGERLEVQLTN